MGAAKAKRRKIKARMDVLRGAGMSVDGKIVPIGSREYERVLRRQAEMLSDEEMADLGAAVLAKPEC
jgi:hypothetical protein